MVGIYSGSYKEKKVVKQVPDAVVYINNSPLIKLCPKCDGQIDVNDFITQIATSLSNNTTVGTASFDIAIPKHGHKGAYMVRSGRVFGLNLMDEVDIYMKARFPNSIGEYQFHKVFWGVITSVDESYSGGAQNISVSCESILKWLQLMKTNEHPAINSLDTVQDKNQLNASLATGKTYADMNVYEIIQSTVDITYRNLVVPEAIDTERAVDNNESINIGAIGPSDKKLIEYWKKRFSQIKSSLRMFGISQVDFNENKNISKSSSANQSNDMRLAQSKNPLSPYKINYDSQALMDFKPFVKFDEAKSLDIASSTYKNNLEIINEVKLYTGFEFYMDTTGELVFKPPFWNLDVSENRVYTLEDTDMISYSFSESESEIVTRVEVIGSQEGMVALDPLITPRGIYTNYELARQFGMRSQQIPARQFRTKEFCYYHAISEMDRINANRYRANITIVGRPELRLGIPVYLPSRDIFGYIDNISHNFTFGGQFTTQIQLSAIRRKYVGEDGTSSDLDFNTNGVSFGIRGKPCILIFEKSSEVIKELKKGENLKGVPLGFTPNKDSQDRSQRSQTESTIPLKTNRAGVYREVELTSEDALEILAEIDRAKNSDDQDSYLNFLEVAIPVSDERGYELIGSYENGRSLFLNENNILVKKGNSFSAILESVLKKVNKQSSYKASGITTVESYTKQNETQGTTDDFENSSVRAKASKVSSFLQSQTKSILDINPKDSIDFKKCSCYEASLSSQPMDNKNNKTISSKTNSR
jgi:hypothetical protein